ncbi:hypothetical protein M408DRAFT_220764 [Serendipita vermifera MAFF 305830]|uniref:Uncharacterized protein n=1 Tax=Serendipita vermifera MAFF 305830 TaxID=933852 RepID=A0A0C2WFI6_SERVB|nr:hypothetical protein M408DRAFT_220764 [Serendipita vermifera MAFF 305830]
MIKNTNGPFSAALPAIYMHRFTFVLPERGQDCTQFGAFVLWRRYNTPWAVVTCLAGPSPLRSSIHWAREVVGRQRRMNRAYAQSAEQIYPYIAPLISGFSSCV